MLGSACSKDIPALYVFPATLSIDNGTTRTIYVTPIGIDAKREYSLLPILLEKEGQYYFSPIRKDFMLLPSSRVSLKFDYDDCQFSGIVLINDRRGLRTVMVTADKFRNNYYFPPLQPLYQITSATLAQASDLTREYGYLFTRFRIP